MEGGIEVRQDWVVAVVVWRMLEDRVFVRRALSPVVLARRAPALGFRHREDPMGPSNHCRGIRGS